MTRLAIYRTGVTTSDAPVLLTMPGYHGTLAAARCLGEHGIPVVVAGPKLFAPTRWSRFATRHLSCPPTSRPERLVDWLLEFGARYPGHVLYPSGDDPAWLYAQHRADLSRNFRLYQPPVEVIETLLDKGRLQRAAAEAGLEMPNTWFPAGGDDVDRLSAEIPYPVLIKPRTQVLFFPGSKGQIVTSPAALRPAYERLTRRCAYAPQLLERDPGVAHPMLQAFHPEAAQSIYNLSGFADETGELFAVRASRKLLQQPRRLGVGLCFEVAKVDAVLADRLRALCRRAGYHGAFEAEFIQRGPRFLLIDFNPRFYGQMAFDIARGLSLPLLVYEAALGRRDRLRSAVEQARVERSPPGVFCNRTDLAVLLRLQRLAGNMDAAEAARWRRWLAAHRDAVTDPLAARGDRGPQLAHLAEELLRFLRHPRSFLVQFGSFGQPGREGTGRDPAVHVQRPERA